MRESCATPSPSRSRTALVMETTFDSLRLMVTLTVELAIASAVRFANAVVSPVMVVSNICSGCSVALQWGNDVSELARVRRGGRGTHAWRGDLW